MIRWSRYVLNLMYSLSNNCIEYATEFLRDVDKANLYISTTQFMQLESQLFVLADK